MRAVAKTISTNRQVCKRTDWQKTVLFLEILRASRYSCTSLGATTMGECTDGFNGNAALYSVEMIVVDLLQLIPEFQFVVCQE